MRLHTSAQIEALTGLTTGNQRAWRTNGLLARGTATPGGHWRYSDEDALFISAARVAAAEGIDLAVAVAVADMCLTEIADQIAGRAPVVERPFLFISRFGDTPPEWLHAPASTSEIKAEGRLVHAEQPYQALITRLKDLNLIPQISTAGGRVLMPMHIARQIPAAVADLFREEQD